MHASTPFSALDDYIALPRVSSLRLSPDGSALVAGVGLLNSDRTAWTTSLWDVDPAGERPARRLTRGAKGESPAAFTRDGDLLFLAQRPEDDDEDDAPAALWLLPAGGGEPHVVATHPGGFGAVRVCGDTIVVSAGMMPGASSIEEDARLRTLRKKTKVDAILHTRYPVRYWDHDLGPDAPHLLAASLTELVSAEDAAAGDAEPRLTPRDLTPDAGSSLVEASFDLAPDGSFLVSEWRVTEALADERTVLVRIDVTSGARLVVAGQRGYEAFAPVIAPDSHRVAYTFEPIATSRRIHQPELHVMAADGRADRRLAPGWAGWPGELRWLPDDDGLVMATDADGRRPLFRVPLNGEDPLRLTEDGAFSDLQVCEDGSAAYALLSSYEFPAEVVCVDLRGAPATVQPLRGPAPRPALPGRLTEVEATVEDGSRVRGWLCLPEGASAEEPAPLLLWVHGGPLNSWNAWSWRWCPWVMVAQGYAVLLPDPALSTGYGHDFVQRGWGAWGGTPYTDLMTITDAVEARDDIDAGRTAAMGGSFGGYMANWIAGHTDRFRGIVTHASLWCLEGFGKTTDVASEWSRELSPRMSQENSPHRFVDQIRTPMLVIHGDRDYRVPISEGLRLWYELLSASGLPAAENGDSEHQFLYFPHENHWILSPQHAIIWYQVVLNFLARTVLDETEITDPAALGLSVADESVG
ncbi:S9 family peptidase [Nigerium massiliense]|uniref:S9 family peptidase n=1 Tax=Nigerium massiliense TaxID=1522317 RepID=UPI00058D7014|nr:alpha/beta fold hydrolase [Nigerium massiliense]